jgi:hypothetical protein
MRRSFAAGILVTVGVVTSVVFASGVSSQFVGAQQCGECHQSAYEAWKGSLHAKAHDGLTGRQAEDPRCIQCHGVGDAANGGVQCESCHGPGKHYAVRYVMKDAELSRIVGLVDVTEKTCRRCHTDTSPSIQPYEQERMWQTVSHGLDAPASP